MAGTGHTTRHIAVPKPSNAPPVGAILDCNACRAQPHGHRIDPVAFLDAQFFDAGHMGYALGKGCHHRQHRIFVDHAGGAVGGHFDPVQVGREPRTQVGDWLAPLGPFVLIGQVCAHLAKRLIKACARRVEANGRHQHVRAGHNQRGTDREGGRGRIARHVDMLGRQFWLTFEGDDPALIGDFGADLGAKARQHPLGMVTSGLGLNHDGFSGGVEACEQDGGLYLSRRNRHRVIHGHRVCGPHQRHGQTPARTAHGLRAKLGKRVRDPRHGPLV
mmetsp:Transcript_23422/g.41089  ORF Transcript_23422/g.41089 Transcript_23422/m.41089 type:complete len:274 (-) Transcript_23422:2081-2902(-)